MNINDLFRSLFGISSRYDEDIHRRDVFHSHDEEEGLEGQDDLSEFNNINDIFHHFHGDMMVQMAEIQRQMGDMFINFGAIDFPGGEMERRESQRDSGSLRDKMLKENDEEPSDNKSNSPFGRFFGVPNWSPMIPKQPKQKVDVDLDKDVSAGNVADLFRSEGYLEPRGHVTAPSGNTSHFQSVSIRKIRRPDGTVEERRTTRDSAGNEETIVTQSDGGKSHTVTTRKNSTGETEVIKNSTDKMSRFDHFWQPSVESKEKASTPENKVTDISIFKKLFGKILPENER